MSNLGLPEWTVNEDNAGLAYEIRRLSELSFNQCVGTMSTVIEKAPKLNELPGIAARSDEDLLLGYRDTQQRELFEELVRRYERELFSYLRRYVGDAEMAADVFQGTFLQLHLKCKQFQVGRKLRPWLYAIATNQAIDAQRRNRRHRMVSLDRLTHSDDDDVVKLLDMMASDEMGPDEHFDLQENRNRVRQAVLELPEHLRSVVLLVYYQGLKYREAAEAISIPVGTVKSRMHTAMLKLNEVWKDAHMQSK